MISGGGARDNSGFSLVELMVALVIGMLGIIVMMQVLAMSEGQKRTTTGGDAAISSGSVSLYGLQRDLQQAGWGSSAINVIGCNVTGLTTGGAAIPLLPVVINHASVPAGDTNTDTLLIVSGNGNDAVEGDQVLSGAGTSYAVRTPSAFAVNDWVVVGRQTRVAGACTLNATRITAVTSSDVTVAAATANFTIAPNDRLFQLGANPAIRVYAIRNGNLTVCDWRANDCTNAAAAAPATLDSSVWVPVANNVVSLRAQYGRDTATGPMDGILDVWDRTIPTVLTPISTAAGKNIEACAFARIPGVRVALVARSSQPEKTLDWPNTTSHITAQARAWTDVLWMGSDDVAYGISNAQATAAGIRLPDPDATWPTRWDFRYKVFQTVVPLRNITSQGVLDEC